MTTWILLGGMVLLFGVMFFFTNKKRKKEEQERQEKMDALVPGAKILTIGGIMGEIVESHEAYIVIATGTQENKSYITLDKRGISGLLDENTYKENQETEEIVDKEQQEEIVEETQE